MIAVHNYVADLVLNCLNTAGGCVAVADKFATAGPTSKEAQSYRVARYVTIGALHTVVSDVITTFGIAAADLVTLGGILQTAIPLASSVDFTATLTQSFTADPCGGTRTGSALIDQIYRAQFTSSTPFGTVQSSTARYSASANDADNDALGPFSLWSGNSADATFSFYDGIHQHPGYTGSSGANSWNPIALGLTASLLKRNYEADAANYDPVKLNDPLNLITATAPLAAVPTVFNTLKSLFSDPLFGNLGVIVSGYPGTPFVPTQDCPTTTYYY